MDPEKISLNFIFPTKYVIPKRLKFSHWPSKLFLECEKKDSGTPKNLKLAIVLWFQLIKNPSVRIFS